jgi:3-oxoacyl-[acyl-carrier protein] reductase
MSKAKTAQAGPTEKSNNRGCIWITGARRGIGAAVARAMAETGAALALSARKQSDLKELGDELSPLTDVRTYSCDVTAAESVTACYTAISSDFGAVDTLVNNAGVGIFKPMLELSVDEFDASIAANLRGVFLCTRSVLPAMIQRKKGRVVTINSIAASTSFANCTAYAASKAGVLAFNRSLREEVREHGVRIMDILPGATATAIWPDDMLSEHEPKMMQAQDVALIVRDMLQAPDRATIEELTVRPWRGDL